MAGVTFAGITTGGLYDVLTTVLVSAMQFWLLKFVFVSEDH